jgi:hypothetical protein
LFTYPTPSSVIIANSDGTEYTDESIFGITPAPDFCIVHIRIEKLEGKLVLESCVRLPVLPLLPFTCASTIEGSETNGRSLAATPTATSGTSTGLNSNGINTTGVTTNPLKKIIPVDPMAWGWTWDFDFDFSDYPTTPTSPVLSRRSRSRINISTGGSGRESTKRYGRGGWEEHDVLLSVSECGELGFWVPEARSSNNSNNVLAGVNGVGGAGSSVWRCTGRVRTERRGFNRARCSSAKKTALGRSLFHPNSFNY